MSDIYLPYIPIFYLFLFYNRITNIETISSFAKYENIFMVVIDIIMVLIGVSSNSYS